MSHKVSAWQDSIIILKQKQRWELTDFPLTEWSVSLQARSPVVVSQGQGEEGLGVAECCDLLWVTEEAAVGQPGNTGGPAGIVGIGNTATRRHLNNN